MVLVTAQVKANGILLKEFLRTIARYPHLIEKVPMCASYCCIMTAFFAYTANKLLPVYSLLCTAHWDIASCGFFVLLLCMAVSRSACFWELTKSNQCCILVFSVSSDGNFETQSVLGFSFSVLTFHLSKLTLCHQECIASYKDVVILEGAKLIFDTIKC